MRRLGLPDISSLELFDQCVQEMDQRDKTHFLANRVYMVNAAQHFDAATTTKTWCYLPQAVHGNGAAVISGTLTKSELTAVYTKNTVKSNGLARQIYDKLLVAANGKCPYCGGIGDPKTLDHYLPKARFPLYSVMPENLVPCCRDCNSEMRAAFPAVPNEQNIHPYLDGDHFFSDKWTTAVVQRTDPITVRYSVSAPTHWSVIDQDRVRHHFKGCDLALRYSKQVSTEMGTLIDWRKGALKNLPEADFRAYLCDAANCDALPINGWKRTLYTALSQTRWFCNSDFNSPHGHMP